MLKKSLCVFGIVLASIASNRALASAAPESFFDLTATDMEGKPAPLAQYKGKVVLAVNTASRCGFTPQYKGLQALQEKYAKKGFTVLGFPSNDFMGQEPGSNTEIKKFCELNYKINFPLFAKAPVTGSQKQPVYRFLTERSAKEFQGEISWNFNKFLISKEGKVVARFGSRTAPEDEELVTKIEQALKQTSEAATSKN